MKQFNLIFLLSILVFTLSCDNKAKEKHCGIKSFEFNSLEDTVNLVDCNGKQGVWIPNLLNKLQDTVYYRNDTVVN